MSGFIVYLYATGTHAWVYNVIVGHPVQTLTTAIMFGTMESLCNNKHVAKQLCLYGNKMHFH